MASIANDSGGRRRIQFVAPDGARKAIRLGKVSQRFAEGVKLRIEHLLAARMTGGAPDADTARWVAGLDDTLAERLAAVGVIPKRESVALKAFLDDYIAGRADVKGSTATVLGHTRRNLVDFFGPERPLRDITPGEADQWRLYLVAEGLADNTVRRRCGIAKQFFRAALRRRLIAENPFADLKAAVQANRSRDYFLSTVDAKRVLDACPDAQWRLLFALSRYAGLRCPSEHLGLRWGDVDWERGRMRVHSPKTEHHEGGESRLIPIFPELRPHLEEAFEQAGPGTEFVITRYRESNINLRTQLERIIRRAGLEPWPKLFQNLRSTRETELAQTYPLHVVCAWIGNTHSVAMKHYLQVTDADFDRAAAAGARAAQNPAQQAHAESRREMFEEPAAHEKTPEMPGCAVPCEVLQTCSVGDTGLEPVTPSLSS